MRATSKIIRCAFVSLFLAGGALAERKPNILFIAIDDMNDWTGFLGGHPQAITPNMDKLAKKGVNFTNAHCAAPGCSPSRNSLLYGVEPFHSGLYAFYDQGGFSEEFMKPYTSLPELLQANGYDTYGSGKIHHRKDPTPREWTEYAKEKNKGKAIFDETEGYGKGKMSFRPTLHPLEDHVDYMNTTFGVDILARKHDKPFFLAVGLIKPHLPFNAPKQFFDLYPKQIEPPRINPKDHDDIPAVGNAWAKRRDDNQFKKDNAWNEVRRAYLACISWTDFNVGRLIDALEKSPYADNTVVVLWSDHGFAQGEKNHFRKFALWEETTRVPFIIWDARDKNAPVGRTVADGVSLINIYRTLTDLSGVAAPAYVDGFSLVPWLKDPGKPVAEPAICTWGRGNFTLRNKDWRYIRYYDGGEELYLHTKDPDEWTNLANNPEYAAVKKSLAAYLPKTEAPLILEGLEGGLTSWSIPYSADKPLGEK
jgi:arylsulfatase A-like enzyme